MEARNNIDFHEHGNFPDHLRDYNSLVQHFRSQFKDLTNTEKGSRFAHFSKRLIPHTEIGSDFEDPELSENVSHDGGVDLIARGKDGISDLYIQSRLHIDEASTLDSIISKFSSYYTEKISKKATQIDLFGNNNIDQKLSKFLIITLSDISNIVNLYEQREYSSKAFYRDLKSKNCIDFIDGQDIYSVLKSVYRKIAELPSRVELNLESPYLNKGNVYLGIISGKELKRLYQEFGDALFFENIRDFLGTHARAGRTSPNQAIMKTIAENPDKMLERNNGISFRADRIETEDSERKLILSRGSVVNGCQTTMCIVRYSDGDCYVPVKIVQTQNPWDIAEAANFQNFVAEIDLKISKNLRPQLAKIAATQSGVVIGNGEKSALQIIEAIYSQRVAYKETRLLYLGLFSQTPNNIIESDHARLEQKLIDKFYEYDQYGAKIFEALFMLQDSSQKGLEEAGKRLTDESYADIVSRFYKEDSPQYRCFVSILALCGALRENISKRNKDINEEFKRMNNFLNKTQFLLVNREDIFLRYYRYAVKSWMRAVTPPDANEERIRQNMNLRARSADFSGLYRWVTMDADDDEWLVKEEESFQKSLRDIETN